MSSFFGTDHATNGSRRRIRKRPEQDLQRQIYQFIGYAMSYNCRPLTDWLFHCPNGGARNGKEAAIMKGIGVKPGVNDFVLPIACGGFGGLWIELKTSKTGLTDNQIHFHQRLREGGQCVHTCRTLTEVVNAICDYLRPSGRFVLRAQP